jgi:hypothetical protein
MGGIDFRRIECTNIPRPEPNKVQVLLNYDFSRPVVIDFFALLLFALLSPKGGRHVFRIFIGYGLSHKSNPFLRGFYEGRN